MIGALIGVLGPLIPVLIQSVEKIFSGKPKAGEDKLNAVVNCLLELADTMLSGKIPLPDGSLIADKSVDASTLKGAVESVFQQLKGSGQLGSQPQVGQLYLLQGIVTALNRQV